MSGGTSGSVSDVLKLARPDIRALQPYAHAAWEPTLERLHANENPWRPLDDNTIAGLNRYPEPQPRALLRQLAQLYDVDVSQVLVSRGSDEAIDLLTRAFCGAGEDAILICPPTFGMYAVAAQIQGAGVVSVPLHRDRGFALDADAVLAAVTPRVKLLFLCSPNNPTGNLLDRAAMLRLADRLVGRALVVVDEAYVEFAGAASLAAELPTRPNLVVLRTLSKAHGLAGARLGALLAAPEIVALLRKIIPPYAIAELSIEAALRALQTPQRRIAEARVAAIVAERERLAVGLRAHRAVSQIWPSAANFLLTEMRDIAAAFAALRRAGLLVRDFGAAAGLGPALRITVGTPEQNDRVIASLA